MVIGAARCWRSAAGAGLWMVFRKRPRGRVGARAACSGAFRTAGRRMLLDVCEVQARMAAPDHAPLQLSHRRVDYESSRHYRYDGVVDALQVRAAFLLGALPPGNPHNSIVWPKSGAGCGWLPSFLPMRIPTRSIRSSGQHAAGARVNSKFFNFTLFAVYSTFKVSQNGLRSYCAYLRQKRSPPMKKSLRFVLAAAVLASLRHRYGLSVNPVRTQRWNCRVSVSVLALSIQVRNPRLNCRVSVSVLRSYQSVRTKTELYCQRHFSAPINPGRSPRLELYCYSLEAK